MRTVLYFLAYLFCSVPAFSQNYFPRNPVTYLPPAGHSAYFSPHADVGLANPKNLTYEILMTLTWDSSLPAGNQKGREFVQAQAAKKKGELLEVAGRPVFLEEGTKKNGMRIYHYIVGLDRGFVHISWTDAKTPNENRDVIVRGIIASLKEVTANEAEAEAL